MCVEVTVKKGGVETFCQTNGELAAALGLSVEQVGPDPYDHCLCRAYLDQLGARKATDEEGWPMPAKVIEVTPL